MCVHRPRARQSHGGVVWPGSILLAFTESKIKKVCVDVSVSPLVLHVFSLTDNSWKSFLSRTPAD